MEPSQACPGPELQTSEVVRRGVEPSRLSYSESLLLCRCSVSRDQSHSHTPHPCVTKRTRAFLWHLDCSIATWISRRNFHPVRELDQQQNPRGFPLLWRAAPTLVTYNIVQGISRRANSQCPTGFASIALMCHVACWTPKVLHKPEICVIHMV